MLTHSDFNKIKALQSHKETLKKSSQRMSVLIETIDKTILHLKGKKIMQDKEFYNGFDSHQKDHEEYLVNYYGTVAEDLILECKKRTLTWDTSEWNNIKREGNAIYQALSECIEKGLGPRSDMVQSLIHQHCQMIERFYSVSKDIYMALAQLYCEHSGFRKFFDLHHPKLITFIAEAMRFYAYKHLS